MKRRQKKRAQHSADAVRAHMAEHHPRCPSDVVEGIGTYIAGRCWRPPVTIGGAVGIGAVVYVRHRLTDYDHLLRKHRLTRAEARLVVAPEIASIIRSWKSDPTGGGLPS